MSTTSPTATTRTNELLRIDSETEEYQLKRLADVKLARNDDAVRAALAEVQTTAADSTRNLMPAIIDAVKAYATLEEIAMAMEAEFGTYVEKAII